MQAPEQTNSVGFNPTNQHSTAINAVGVIPRTGLTQPGLTAYPPRIYGDSSTSIHGLTSANTAHITPVSQVLGTGIGMKAVPVIASGQSMNLVGNISNPIGVGTVSLNTQSISAHVAMSVPTAPVGLTTAVVPTNMASHAGPVTVGPPGGSHIAISPYTASPANISPFISVGSHIPNQPPVGSLHLGNSHRPISAVQPQQVPVVQPMPSGAMSVSHSGQAQQFQRLKVEDALSYLDQVKLQFGNHPQVYNDFLDIMKEFKSQSIDTPGVISRVSNLFRGHPELIVGFNTFLPPGYKIEVQANDTISVQQPGQPSMSLSQFAGNSGREPISHPFKKGSQPVNMSISSAVSAHTDGPRTGLDNVAAAASGSISSTPGQPVEFNHAINYVNKIKNRFQSQPDIYKNFLEILHKYQKEQKQIKEGIIAPTYKPLTETEVYTQVSKLFHNQEDLLKEFGQFLPDANGNGGLFGKQTYPDSRDHLAPVKKQYSMTNKNPAVSKLNSAAGSIRKLSSSGIPPQKKPKLSSMTGLYNKDVSFAEAGKYGTHAEYAFFEKVKKALRSQEVYDNFLRCLQLFSQEIVSHNELVQLVQPFLSKFPELFRRFKEMIGYKDGGPFVEPISGSSLTTGLQAKPQNERMMRDDLAMEIDYSTCKRYGPSYRGLPKSYHPPRCSGRTSLCREVLNDTWVSFPSWSEESTFVTSRKTQYEESIYRCEDERFELDMVIELNLATIRVLEGVHKRLQRMSSEEAAKLKLDNNLGGTSDNLHRKAIQRIYGDKAAEIIDGLKKNPVVAVPLVLRRLKTKDDEWKEAQRQFNKIWREQNEKYYLKSLDHQGINFKQNDIKSLRSKNLINEIEAIYDAMNKKIKSEIQNNSPIDSAIIAPTAQEAEKCPHLLLPYKDPLMVDEAMSLIIHHARRQASTQKKDKQMIKQLMRQTVQKLFHRLPVPLSDDEDEEESEDGENGGQKAVTTYGADKPVRSASRGKASSPTEEKTDPCIVESPTMNTNSPDSDCNNGDTDRYSLFYANSNWYSFLRLHQILCHRLHIIKTVCDKHVAEHDKCKQDKSDSVAVALRLKMPNDLEPHQYFNNFLDLVKSLLDGNIESSVFEDQLRELFGIHGYIAFTMDKVIQNIVKQLQYIVADELCRDVATAWVKEQNNRATGGNLTTRQERTVAETAYKKHMEELLHDDNCFEILVSQRYRTMAVTLLDTDQEGSVNSGLEQEEKWNEFIDKYMPGDLDPDISDQTKEHLKKKPVFLTRNLNSSKKRNSRLFDKPSIPKKIKLKQSLKNLERSDEEGNSENRDKATDDADELKSSEGMNMDEEDVACDISDGKPENTAEVEVGLDIPDDLEVLDNQECKFDVNAFKMVFVVNSNSILYRGNAFSKAKKTHKKVSESMYRKWSAFCKQWRESYVIQQDSVKIRSWLNGDYLEDCKPCKTVCRRDNNINKPPYRLYNRYFVKYDKTSVPSANDGASATSNSLLDSPMDTV